MSKRGRPASRLEPSPEWKRSRRRHRELEERVWQRRSVMPPADWRPEWIRQRREA